MAVVAVTTNSSVERSTREAAESSSLHGPELHPLAASVTIILSEPLLVAMMHSSNTMLARFGTAGAMAAASTPREARGAPFAHER